MPHTSFNKKILELIVANPNDATLKLIKEYKKRKQKDFYSTLVILGGDIGFDFFVVLIQEKGKASRYLPVLKFYPNNDFGEEPRTIELIESNSSFKELIECESYLAKEYIYHLMRLSNFETVMNEKLN